jgi:hypothetical protein
MTWTREEIAMAAQRKPKKETKRPEQSVTIKATEDTRPTGLMPPSFPSDYVAGSVAPMIGARMTATALIVQSRGLASRLLLSVIGRGKRDEIWRRLMKGLFDPYRPELHYMRGPGPRADEKRRNIRMGSAAFFG